MTHKSKMRKLLSLTIGLFALIVTSGVFSEGMAQSGRDPFEKPSYKKKKVVRPKSSAPSNGLGRKASGKTQSSQVQKPKGPVQVAPPNIQERIDYYKRIREEAAMNGQPIPKVTSVLLLSEMTISGIFKTPRGYAAMVEATPIKLSYTIYPGEKFFDGQLVAIEENRLIFRKVNKLSNGKFISSVENMPLRKYSMQQEIQGTVPQESSVKPESASKNPMDKENEKTKIVSPLEEMNRQPAEDSKESAKGKSEKDKRGKTRSSKRKSKLAKKN